MTTTGAAVENPQQTVSDALPKKPNKFKKLLDEGLRGEALNDQIYIMALSDAEVWEDFKPKKLPLYPAGFHQSYEKYRQTKKSERSEAWKALQEEFPGYFKAVEEADSFNSSRLRFLHEMLDHLKAKGMSKYADTVQSRIYEYDR